MSVQNRRTLCSLPIGEGMNELKKSISVVLAKSIVNLDPKAQIIGLKIDNMGFSCDFMGEDLSLSIIEEQMNSIIREKEEFNALEMMSNNAAALFKDRKQKNIAEQLISIRPCLVDICRLGDFYCLSAGPYTQDVKFFQLDAIEQIGDKKHIKGVIFSSKKELKDFVKRRKSVEKLSYMLTGQKMRLFEKKDNGDLLWLINGLILKQSLIGWWQEEHVRQGFEIVGEPIPFRDKYAYIDGDVDIAFSRQQNTRVMDFFGLEYTEKKEGKKTTLYAEDLLGIEWPLSWVEGNRRSTFGSIDRFIAILLEKYEGNLPFWLKPEHTRIIGIDSKNEVYCWEIYEKLRKLGLRVKVVLDKNRISEKISAAQKERIPYILVIGDKEQNNGTVTICPCDKDVVENVVLEDFFKGENLV
jgi:threonyl-tRNA synthetase